MGTDRLIYFRTDGNSKIATGHLMRCLAIAQACLSAGNQVCFLVSDKESKSLLREFDYKHNFSIHVLESASYDQLDKELPELLTFLKDSSSFSHAQGTSSFVADPSTEAFSRPVLFLDSYYVTEHYMNTVRSAALLVYLDDLQLFDYPCDLLINYDVIPNAQLPSYETFYAHANKLLLGASYTPLRRQFSLKRSTFRKEASSLLIATGGSDPYHFALQLISTFQETPHPFFSGKIHLVLGRLNQDKTLLYHLEENLPFLTIHENVGDMASLMETCDLAISAAGTTLYELCAIGIPTISYAMADNQVICAQAFLEAGAVPYAGDIRDSSSTVILQIAEFIKEMSANPAKRKTAHENVHSLVDGNGAKRIAAEILKLS